MNTSFCLLLVPPWESALSESVTESIALKATDGVRRVRGTRLRETRQSLQSLGTGFTAPTASSPRLLEGKRRDLNLRNL